MGSPIPTSLNPDFNNVFFTCAKISLLAIMFIYITNTLAGFVVMLLLFWKTYGCT